MCVGECWNTAGFRDAGCDEPTLNGAKVCVLDDDTEPERGLLGDKCVVCVNTRETGRDRGCSNNRPDCVLDDGTPPPIGTAGTACGQVDECALGLDNCSANAECYDELGGFSCVCKEGYTGDGVTCEDIDECERGPCNAFQECVNFDGSYFCAFVERRDIDPPVINPVDP